MSTNSLLDSYIQLRLALNAVRAKETKNLEFGPSQITVLYRLSLSDATMGELVEKAMTDKASMTRTVSSLIEAGLVRRKPDENDRRVIRIELTAKGKEKAKLAKKVRDNIAETLESTLNAKDQKTFVELINKITTHLNAQLKD